MGKCQPGLVSNFGTLSILPEITGAFQGVWRVCITFCITFQGFVLFVYGNINRISAFKRLVEGKSMPVRAATRYSEMVSQQKLTILT